MHTVTEFKKDGIVTANLDLQNVTILNGYIYSVYVKRPRMFFLEILFLTIAVAQMILLSARQLIGFRLNRILVLVLRIHNISNLEVELLLEKLTFVGKVKLLSEKSDFCWKSPTFVGNVRLLSEK